MVFTFGVRWCSHITWGGEVVFTFHPREVGKAHISPGEVHGRSEVVFTFHLVHIWGGVCVCVHNELRWCSHLTQ